MPGPEGATDEAIINLVQLRESCEERILAARTEEPGTDPVSELFVTPRGLRISRYAGALMSVEYGDSRGRMDTTTSIDWTVVPPEVHIVTSGGGRYTRSRTLKKNDVPGRAAVMADLLPAVWSGPDERESKTMYHRFA